MKTKSYTLTIELEPEQWHALALAATVDKMSPADWARKVVADAAAVTAESVGDSIREPLHV